MPKRVGTTQRAIAGTALLPIAVWQIRNKKRAPEGARREVLTGSAAG
jgi:hypothetical protein